MVFKEALKAMKDGAKVKLPAWSGYWFWDEEKETIIMHTKRDVIMDIRETERVEYTTLNICSDEWIIADEHNTPILGGVATFNFETALKYIKRGINVTRRKYCENGLVVHLSSDGDSIVVEGNTSYFIFEALLEDLTAEDWMFAEMEG